MKKLFSLMLVFFAAAAVSQEVNPFKMTIELKDKDKIAYKAGSEITVKIQCECPETYQLAGWRALAFLPGLPENFCEAAKLSPGNHKDPKWRSVQLHPWTWLKNQDVKETECTISTGNWPEGNYQVSFNILFRDRARRGAAKDARLLPDKSMMQPIQFVLEK